jgi:acyl-ACP thioesterase
VVRAPEHYQRVTVRTWPHSLSRFSFIRDFQLLDEQGGLLVKATSEWVLMDVATRKFVSARGYYTGPTDFVEDRSFPKKPRKAPNFEQSGEPARVVVPSYSDIDVNGHVNNAMYARFIVDALAPGEADAIRTFQIDYRMEALVDEPLSVYTHVEDGLVLVKGVREDGDTSFAGAIELDDAGAR